MTCRSLEIECKYFILQFTNKYSDTSFKIVSFSRFLFTIWTFKTFSEETDDHVTRITFLCM